MPKKRKIYDHEETFDTVLKPMIEKMERVCKAFDIPYMFVTQPSVREDGVIIRGSVFTPDHTEASLGFAANVANAKGYDDLERMVMHAAASIALNEMRGAQSEKMRDLFSELGPAEGDKPVN